MADPKVKVRILADASQAKSELRQTQSAFTRFGSSIKSNALKIGASVAALGVAFQGIRDAAKLEGSTEALARNLAAQGLSFDKFIAKLKEVSDAQVSTADLIESSSRALLLGIPAEQIADLLEIARARAIALGLDVGSAFDQLTTGLARKSIPILDNLGFTMVDLKRATDDYAASLGTTAEKLSDAQRGQALLNGVMQQGVRDIGLYGDAQGALVGGVAQVTTMFENLFTVIKKVGLGLGGALVSGLANVTSKLLRFAGFLSEIVIKLGELGSALPLVGDQFTAMGAKAVDARNGLLSLQNKVDDFGVSLSSATDQIFRSLLGLDDIDKRARKAAGGIGAAAGAADDAGGNFEELGDAVDEAGDSMASFVVSQRAVRNELVATSQQLIITSGDFTRYERQFGRGAANAQALEDGASIQGGRLRLAGGATRLLRDEQGLFPGISGGSYSYTTQRSFTDPDGRIVFNATRSRFRL